MAQATVLSHVPRLVVTDTASTPLGSGSLSVTPVAVDGPLLATTSSYVAVSPIAMRVGETVLLSARLAWATTPATSVSVLFVGSPSPPPSTDAVLARFTGAPGSTVAVMSIGGYVAPAASASARVQVTVGPLLQVHPTPVAAVTEKSAPSNASVTVTGPDVLAPPAFVTARWKTAVPPAVKTPVWLLSIVRSGVCTLVVTGALAAWRGRPSVCEKKSADAVFTIEVPDGTGASIRTRKRTVAAAPGATLPPAVALAPLPTRNTTLFVAASNSPASSPAASVSGAPPSSEPAMNVDRSGIGSRRTTRSAPSWPSFGTRTVYSSTSPGSTAPPLRSVTDLTGCTRGAKSSVMKTAAPGR